ncbi:MAG: ABC transporter ATP-binding protein [Desulfovibrio sp.]
MILDVNSVSFHYKSSPILNDVEFNVRGGELVAILGPNGVGKTTLLKCLNAIHRPSCGVVEVKGENILSMKPEHIARCVGYVAQKNEVAQLTVFDTVLMGRTPHIKWRVGKRDIKIVDASLDHMGLTHLSLRSVDCLSGGELQKVAMARALVQEPQLLLLDEPTSALDLKNQVDILQTVRRVVTEHKVAAVMTMHDLNSALRFADKYIFLRGGQIHSAGAVKDVTAQMVEDVYGLPVEIHYIKGQPAVMPCC